MSSLKFLLVPCNFRFFVISPSLNFPRDFTINVPRTESTAKTESYSRIYKINNLENMRVPIGCGFLFSRRIRGEGEAGLQICTTNECKGKFGNNGKREKRMVCDEWIGKNKEHFGISRNAGLAAVADRSFGLLELST